MSANSKSGRTHKQSRLAGGARVRRAGSLPEFLRLVALPGLLLFSSACNSNTVLQAGFNSDTVGSPPSATQSTGTVSIAPGTVVVVAAPLPNLPANKWARLTKPTDPDKQTSLKGNFSRVDGLGNYTLEASLFIPSGTGAVSVSFEGFIGGDNSPSFLHLDFMPDGDVRVDDDEKQRFGHFPRDQSFALTVNLVITDAKATAHVQLFGTGASGSADVTVNPNFNSVAAKFGAVRFFMGFPWQGLFFVDDIIVTRKS